MADFLIDTPTPTLTAEQILDISGNGLASLTGLCTLPKLTELYARENVIEVVDGLATRVPALELLVGWVAARAGVAGACMGA